MSNTLSTPSVKKREMFKLQYKGGINRNKDWGTYTTFKYRDSALTAFNHSKHQEDLRVLRVYIEEEVIT